MTLKRLSALLLVLVMTFALLPFKQIGTFSDPQSWAQQTTEVDDNTADFFSVFINHLGHIDAGTNLTNFKVNFNLCSCFNAELPPKPQGKILVPPPDFSSSVF